MKNQEGVFKIARWNPSIAVEIEVHSDTARVNHKHFDKLKFGGILLTDPQPVGG